MSEIVTYQLDGGIATITMDDGKVNALSPEMVRSLHAAFDWAEADGAVVILTGRTGKFSAGFELPTLAAGGEVAADMLDGGFKLALRILSFPAPVIIACTGHAIAMGLFLLISGDYRIGVSGPYRLQANEVALGLAMPTTILELCRLRLNPSHLTRVMALAESLTPEQAVPAGILDAVVVPEALESAAREIAEPFTHFNLEAFAATKRRLYSTAILALTSLIAADDASFRSRY